MPTVALVAAVLYPFYQPKLFTIPVFGVWPDVATGVYMLVFIMMAVGLNIVVGYAGLLDLGYVAFYAIGAYTAAWFASLQFARHTIHFGAVGIDPHLPGIHVTLWLLLPLAGILTAGTGILIGLPTLRLRGDYLAIVTLGFGEILPQVARNGDNFFGTGFNLTNGPNGITPLDSPGFGHHLSHGPTASCPRTTSRAATRPSSATRSSRPTSSTGRRSSCCCSPSSARSASSTRASAAPGSRSAKTRPRPRRWACR